MTSVKDKFDLSDKNIVITGGAGFLARYFAEAVSEMGGRPVLLDIQEEKLRETEKLLKEKNIKAKGFTLNLRDKKQVIAVVDKIVEEFGHIDVLINAAAYAMNTLNNLSSRGDYFAALEEYPQDLWQEGIEANLTGTFLITQCIGKVMKGQKKGVIINIASDVAVISPDHRIYEPNEHDNYQGVSFNTPVAYSVSKAGILGLTRYLATYWAKYGIRVNALSPAGVFKNQDQKFVEQLAERIPLGRMAKAEELKGPIVFLASEASSFMTGANLIVDGGRTIW